MQIFEKNSKILHLTLTFDLEDDLLRSKCISRSRAHPLFSGNTHLVCLYMSGNGSDIPFYVLRLFRFLTAIYSKSVAMATILNAMHKARRKQPPLT